MGGIMTNSEKVVGGRFGQGGRLRQVPLHHMDLFTSYGQNKITDFLWFQPEPVPLTLYRYIIMQFI